MTGKILFIKKNFKGIYGFIRCEDGNTYYYDTSSIVKGNYLKAGNAVEFDIVFLDDEKTKAVNVRVIQSAEIYTELENEKKLKVLELLTSKLKQSLFVNCAIVPELLKSKGINYKEYASDLSSFIEKNFFGVFSVKKRIEINGKKYPAVIIKASNSVDKISEEKRSQIENKLFEEISTTGFFEASKFPMILQECEITQYRDYAINMDSFIDTFFPNKFIPKMNVQVNGKRYIKIYVQTEKADEFIEDSWLEKATNDEKKLVMLDAEVVSVVKDKMNEIIENRTYFLASDIPDFLKEFGIENYKLYAQTIEKFIETYFSDTFEMKKNIVIDGKIYPNVVVIKYTICDQNFMLKVKNLYDVCDYEGILKLEELYMITPPMLGTDGIQLLLKALLAYLGENEKRADLNEFQKILIRTEKVMDLKRFKDDTKLLTLGMETSFISFGLDEFKKVFADVHNGKKNLNHSWNGIIERFWSAKNELAVYLTCLWIIICKKEKCIDLYIEEAGKDNRIDKLPTILRVYEEFAMEGKKYISPSLKRKILGRCFDCNDIQALIASAVFFDEESIPEIKEVIEFLEEKKVINSEDLIRWFHSDIGAIVSEKIINYYWWSSSGQGFNSNMFKILASVCWEYPAGYFTEIIYNDSCPMFGRKEKEQILYGNFAQLCQNTKTYKKAYVLLNYLYLNLIENLKDNELDHKWNNLKSWMKSQVLQQLSSDIRTASSIELFRYDNELRQELEFYYCDNFIAEKVNNSSEDELDEFVEECERIGLHFITQWIVDNSGRAVAQDEECYIRSLISSQQFHEAIQFLQQGTSFEKMKKVDILREILSENFNMYHMSEKAYTMFPYIIPVEVAESALLHHLTFMERNVLVALIAIYVYKKEWLKVAFLYAPFKKMHFNAHRKFIDDVKSRLSENNINPSRNMESHYDVMKVALKVCDFKEFDDFVNWAKKIPVPNTSKVYVPKVKTFDNTLKNLLSESNYDNCWKQLVITALRTDNDDKQDNLRYCIIASFVGRYGIEQFNQVLYGLVKNKYSVKSFTDYYTSLWKGLSNGRYSLNFLILSQALISEAPVTFWNMFYDIAICKNHVFSTDSFEFQTWKDVIREDQKFYNGVLDQYNSTRETVFLKIAARMLLESNEKLDPSFEKYLPYCNSSRNKDFLFFTLIQLVYRGKYLQEISELLDSNYWRCSEIEQKLARMLFAFCTNKVDGFFENIEQIFSIAEIESFRKDYLKCALNYPEINIVQTICESIYGRTYKYKLMEQLLQIKNRDEQYYDSEYSALKSEIDAVPEILADWNQSTEIECYLQFVITFYRQQLYQESDDAVYIRNRYYRILAASILLERDLVQYSDDDIVALMKRNKHFTGVYSGYERFKKSLYEFMNLCSISQELKVVFVIGLISNGWNQFIGRRNEYDRESLQIIKKIESYTNYRDLNIQLIRLFIIERQGDITEKDIKFTEYCSPNIAFVLKQMMSIKENSISSYAQCQKLINGICRLNNSGKAKKSYESLKHYLKVFSNDLKEYWDMYMVALMATSYKKTIIVNLAADIRHNKINIEEIKLWMPVLESIDELQTYYYLLAVRYAIDRKKEDAQKAYSQITVPSALPDEWRIERNNLEAYVLGRQESFFASSNSSISSLVTEKEAADISFLYNVASDIKISISDAMSAYKDIIRGDTEDIIKFDAYKRLFIFVKKPDDLYEIYRQIEGKGGEERRRRLTYNELVIEYGSLLIVFSQELSINQKFEVLSEIFGVYNLLNDINKGKGNIIYRLKNAEQAVLETPGLGFEIWINKQDRIKEILLHPIIDCLVSVFNEWVLSVEECTSLLSSCSTEMQRLEDLEKWRKNWNLPQDCSDYENAFIYSLDEEIKRLKSGANLSISVINSKLEDQSIFYQIENIADTSNLSIVLSNTSDENAAHLEVFIGVNGAELEAYEGAFFTNELELRPGDICGQVYRLHNHVLSSLKYDDKVEVIINVVVGDRIICNNSRQKKIFDYVEYTYALQPGVISDIKKYEIAVPAFSRTIKGFGRDIEKQRIRDYLEQQLVMIYGPSRVGKSSLLNYVSNQYVHEYSARNPDIAVMCTMVADEQCSKSDYKLSMLDGKELTFDNEFQIMDYLFITPMRIAFAEKSNIQQRRRCKYVGEKFSESIKAEIRNILDEDGTVRDKYAYISQILEENNCEVWILFDEFQQIIAYWKGSSNELAELCNDIKYYQNSIKLIFCGSDALVRLFQCENNSDWNEFKNITANNCVFVGALNDIDFCDMMNDRNIWNGLPGSMPWSKEALELLYKYTGGNAICGKLFGNELLEKQKAGEFRRRNFIYPSDITKTAYELLHSEVGMVKNLLVSHNTKNLDDEIPYLIFIAYELMNDRNKSDVSLRKIREFFATKSHQDVDLAIKILIARGILKANSEKRRYGFTTMFYYDFFRSQATDTQMQKISAVEHPGLFEEKSWINQMKNSILQNDVEITTSSAIDIIDAMPIEVQVGIREYYQREAGTIYTLKNNILSCVLNNFYEYLETLRERRLHGKASLSKLKLENIVIDNEYDIQFLLFAYLKPLFPKERLEVSEDTGYGTVRTDILIDKDTCIEVKCSRLSMNEKTLESQIKEDMVHYKQKNIFFFIYDKDKIVRNPPAFKECYEEMMVGKNIYVVIHQPKKL